MKLFFNRKRRLNYNAVELHDEDYRAYFSKITLFNFIRKKKLSSIYFLPFVSLGLPRVGNKFYIHRVPYGKRTWFAAAINNRRWAEQSLDGIS